MSQIPIKSEKKQIPDSFPVFIIVGLSGAGKSTALDVFEDMNFFTVDGLPSALASNMLYLLNKDNLKNYQGVAIGVDIKHSDFTKELENALAQLNEMGVKVRILFLEAGTKVIINRYSTTRRPHPLEKKKLGLEQAINKEREHLQLVRAKADLVVDTSSYSIHDLRRIIQEEWGAILNLKHVLRVHLISFGFKYGMPTESDFVFDLRFLPNPYFEPELKLKTGLEKEIQDYILNSESGIGFVKKLEDFLNFTLKLSQAEGRFRITIGIGCTGGRHRSVAVTEKISSFLQTKGFIVSKEHRHLSLG
ncbi:RNase adapter RapZ [Desulfovibrio litoralis]|uniref:UPF0042 nucleotide-binding protein n=1 Tax=Desulfovibrio litoralis DSM 11393 TaxID=1121455 RepID=A0A1M7SY86_9BACT|nr:RNase adapter RapZ [Desulfovibrio litoralis]SHN63459.1 UPF0042 nucleotide-binding protein [Desulfovibrio litoralis DSM 11393]